MSSRKSKQRPLAFWLVCGFLSVALVLLLMGQTLALIDYELAVQLGLQESVGDVGPFGLQVNRAFAAGDTIVYIPLIAASIVGLLLRQRWSLLTTAAVMGISMYWTVTIFSMLMLLPGTQGYHLEPGIEYWLFIGAFIAFGFFGLLYLLFRGERLLS